MLWCILLYCFWINFKILLNHYKANHRANYYFRQANKQAPFTDGNKKPDKTKPISHFKSKPKWVVREVLYLAALMPDRGCRPIAYTFNRLHEHKRLMTVSKSYVAIQLKKHRYHIHKLRQTIKQKPAKVFPKNQQWALDLTTLKDDNTQHHLALGIIDSGTRYCLNLEVITTKTTITLLRLLLDTIEYAGKPRAIKTDNERCFTSRLFRLSLWVLGIKHQRSDKHCPWQNSKIERLFGTLKRQLKNYRITATTIITELNQFIFWYNHCRPHQALNGKTPAEQHYQKMPNNSGVAVYAHAWNGNLTGFYLPPD